MEVEWTRNEITKIKVTTAPGAYEDTPIAVRTMLTFICNIKNRGEWVRQPPQEIGLLSVIADDTPRDIYWCVFLKFLRNLILTTPTETAMTELLGFLDPWCDGEDVLEDGTTFKFEEEKERQDIYVHHLSAQVALAAVSATARCVFLLSLKKLIVGQSPRLYNLPSERTSVVTDPPVAADPAVDDPAPFDIVTHFLSD